MVDGIRSGGGFDRSKLQNALENLQKRKAELAQSEAPVQSASSFSDAITKSIAEVDKSVRAGDSLPVDAVTGDLDFHEVAAKIKEAELSFDFAMQVRNKLLDAYREVMRMSV